jgi:hypothetical protein
MASRYEDIWHENVSEARFDEIQSRTGHSERETIQAAMSQFLDLPGMDEEPRHVKYEMWDLFTETLVANHGDREAAFAELGIHPNDFDWEAWREYMGY